MKEYSLYKYNCGSLKIFGRRSSRAKHATIEDAVAEYYSHIALLKRVTRYNVEQDNPQVLIVEYTDPYCSRIVGMISSTGLQMFDIVKPEEK